MIPAAKQEYTVESTLKGDDVAMSIDENAIVHLMNILTDLYSDSEMAVLREYSTNAYDSHVEAGNTDPIQVTLPTTLAPFLRIKDQGIGLDADDIRAIYSKYGLSTKTETNEQTGVLGLGCKSALTYTNQFTLIGIKGGRLTNVSVSRDEDGLGHMTIVNESDTDEPNGVEVIIPTKSPSHFGEKADQLFGFWPQGSVLVNGEEPAHIDGLQVTDDITLTKVPQYHYQNAYVVMGNVAYPVDRSKHDFGIKDNFNIIMRVPLGAVHFTPSREQLQYTKRTIRVLDELREKLHAEFPDAITRAINDAPDAPTAMRFMLQWHEAIPKALKDATVTYRGHAMPEKIGSDDGTKLIVSSGERHKDYYGKVKGVGKHSQEDAIPLPTVASAMWVHGFHRTFTPAVKKKLWKWCEDNGVDFPRYFVMTTLKPKHIWISPDQVIAWQPVEAIKLPRVPKATGSGYVGDGRYPSRVSVDGHVTSMDIDPDELADMDVPIYYFNTTTHPDSGNIAASLKELTDDFVLVNLSANRIKKFLRLFPEAQELHEAMGEFAAIWQDSLSANDRFVLSTGMDHYSYGRRLHILPLVSLRDPDLRRAVYLHRTYNGRADELRKQLKFFSQYARIDVSEVNLFEKYPLVESIGYYLDEDVKQDFVLYLNAAYEARNE